MSDAQHYRIYLCGGATCTPKGREQLLRVLEDQLCAWQLTSAVEVRISSCQDRCDYGPNLTIWPGPYHYSRLTPEAIGQIVERHLRHGQPVAELLYGEAARRQFR